MTTEFKLKFKEEKIIHWEEKYIKEDKKHKVNDSDIEALKPEEIKERGHLTLEDLKKIEVWTLRRDFKRVKDNEEELVKKITANVLDSKNEKIELLVKNLHGVGWSIASAILHWFAKGKYPILSLPAIQSCSTYYGNIDDIYNISKIEKFWEKYTEFCREIAAKNNITMRTLDRALWQYSSENPPPKRLK